MDDKKQVAEIPAAPNIFLLDGILTPIFPGPAYLFRKLILCSQDSILTPSGLLYGTVNCGSQKYQQN